METYSPVPDGVGTLVRLMVPEEAWLWTPARPRRVGVLVLTGSSAPLDLDLTRLFAAHGAHALTLRWFDGAGGRSGVCEVPLETFVRAVERLQQEPVDTIAVVGLSKGAEAATLLACVDDRVELTIAVSPTSVVWATVGADAHGRAIPHRSSWSWQGVPLPFVAYDNTWRPVELAGPVAYRTLYEQSLKVDAVATAAAAIPVEQAASDLMLVAGHGDSLWPSAYFAQQLAERRVGAGRQVELVLHELAGHSPQLPGLPAPEPSQLIELGGTPEGDRALGRAAWAQVTRRLGLLEPALPSPRQRDPR